MNISEKSNNSPSPDSPETLRPEAWIGFDWGDKEHAFVFQDQTGHGESGKIQHSAENLHGWLRKIGERCGGPRCARHDAR
jgi:hypothetical protein